jgi:hypothetical protein
MIQSLGNAKVNNNNENLLTIFSDCGPYCVSCNIKNGCEKSLALNPSRDYWILYNTDESKGEASYPNFYKSQQCDTKINCLKCK